MWNECPYKHKLAYIDKEEYFKGNKYTAFGTSVHSVCEKLLLRADIDPMVYFETVFKKELELLDLDLNDHLEFLEQARNIIPHILPQVESYFEEYEVVSVEQLLLEEIKDFDSYGKKFKGFIDLILKTPDGKYHIIDWKTCTWGWNAQRRADIRNVYQLSYYKKFFSEKFDIDSDNIETYFGLLKRTANKNIVEIFNVSNKSKRTDNAMALLKKALININSKNFIKNRLSCRYCVYYKTELCT